MYTILCTAASFRYIYTTPRTRNIYTHIKIYVSVGKSFDLAHTHTTNGPHGPSRAPQLSYIARAL